ncbi:hypothetical protein V5F34_23660, partial [Xanthobacter autotrophicus]
ASGRAVAGNAANAAMLRPERTPRRDLMTRDSAGIPDLGYRLLTDAGRILGALVTMVGVRRLSSRCAGEGLAGGSWGDRQIGKRHSLAGAARSGAPLERDAMGELDLVDFDDTAFALAYPASTPERAARRQRRVQNGAGSGGHPKDRPVPAMVMAHGFKCGGASATQEKASVKMSKRGRPHRASAPCMAAMKPAEPQIEASGRPGGNVRQQAAGTQGVDVDAALHVNAAPQGRALRDGNRP